MSNAWVSRSWLESRGIQGGKRECTLKRKAPQAPSSRGNVPDQELLEAPWEKCPWAVHRPVLLPPLCSSGISFWECYKQSLGLMQCSCCYKGFCSFSGLPTSHFSNSVPIHIHYSSYSGDIFSWHTSGEYVCDAGIWEQSVPLSWGL